MVSIISGTVYLTCLTGLIKDQEFNYWLRVSCIFIFSIGYIIQQDNFIRKGLYSIGVVNWMIVFQFVEMLRLPISYYFCIVKGYGIMGIYVPDLAFNVVKYLIFGTQIFM